MDLVVSGIIAAMQLYFVRELLAAFAIFILGFAAIGLCIATLYMAQKPGRRELAQLAASRNPMILPCGAALPRLKIWRAGRFGVLIRNRFRNRLPSRAHRFGSAASLGRFPNLFCEPKGQPS